MNCSKCYNQREAVVEMILIGRDARYAELTDSVLKETFRCPECSATHFYQNGKLMSMIQGDFLDNEEALAKAEEGKFFGGYRPMGVPEFGGFKLKQEPDAPVFVDGKDINELQIGYFPNTAHDNEEIRINIQRPNPSIQDKAAWIYDRKEALKEYLVTRIALGHSLQQDIVDEYNQLLKEM